MENKIQVHDLTFRPFISANEIQGKVAELGQRIAADYHGKQPLFIGMLSGAFVFLADLVRACQLDAEITFVKIASYEGTKSTGKLKTQLPLQVTVTNRHIILVEDIIDTGRTMKHYLDVLKNHQPASIQIASFLVKPSAIQHPIDIKYVGFEIPDKFVVGYGLDYNELGRNLADIYQLVQ